MNEHTPDARHTDQSAAALSDSLRRHSHAVDDSAVTVPDVLGRARRIRRRRRQLTGVAVAAAVLVVVPAGWAATSSLSTSPPVANPSPAPTATQPSQSPSGAPTETPTSTPSGTPTSTGDRSVPLTTLGIAQGAAPQLAYLQGRALHQGGTTTQLPERYTDVSSYRGGWIAVRHDDASGENLVVQLDNQGNPVSTEPGSGDLVRTDDGTQLSWFVSAASGDPNSTGSLHRGGVTGMGEGVATLEVPAGTMANPKGFLTGGSVVYGTDGTDPGVFVTDFTGGSVRLPGAIGLGGVSQQTDRVAVQTDYLDSGKSCWSVVDATNHTDWSGCDWALSRFSPDGSHVLGIPSNTDGLGAASMAILDATTGEPVASFHSAGQKPLFIADMAWEDDSHVLAVVWQDGAWSMLRLSTGGDVERAAGPVRGDETTAAYHFATTR